MKRVLGSGLIRSAGVYTLANVSNAAMPLVLLPILTRHLDPAQYGVVAMFHVLVGIIGPFVGLSVHGAIQRRYFDRDASTLPEYIGNCFLLLTASTFVMCGLLYAARHLLEAGTGFPSGWFWAVALVAASNFVVQVRLTLWQSQQRPGPFGVLQVLRTAVNLSVAILLVVYAHRGWEGVVVAYLAGNGIFAVVSMVSLVRGGWIKVRPRRAFVANALRFGVPLIPHSLAGFAITATDRVMLTTMVGLGTTGLYMVGAQIGNGLSLLFMSFNAAFAPWLLARLRDQTPEIRLDLVRMTYIAMPVFLLLAGIVTWATPVIMLILVGPEFDQAAQFVGWLAFGSAFNGMYLLVTNYIFYAERTALLFWATASAALLNIGLSYVLIRWNGAVGAAQATAASFFLKFLFTWILSARVHPMPWFRPFRTPVGAA